MPGDITVENTLRVKTVKSYEIEATGSKQKTEVTVFRWYNSCNRYPLLVLAAIQTSYGSRTNCKYQAAYNNVISLQPTEADSELLPSVRVFPNPAVDYLTLEYTLTAPGDAVIDVYSINGSKMITLLNKQMDAGLYRITISPEKEGLTPGHYVIKASLQKTVITEEIIISK